MTTPRMSVIVPTRNRADSVLRLLGALSRQDPVPDGFDVIIVADGCTDRTEARVKTTAWSFNLHVLDLAPVGPALARNCGAALARGEILLFLDDDVEPAPETLRAHADMHSAAGRHVGLGYLPPIPTATGFFAAALRGWWESMFDGPRSPWHRYSFRDLLSGHFSIRRADFESLNGFDTRLSCHEDWEFGYRAIASGLQLTFVSRATAWHHDATDVSKALRRKFEEGIADVTLARLHPELARVLPFGWEEAHARQASRIANLAWRHPRIGDAALRSVLSLLPFYEHWRLRFRWRALLERAMTFQYWRGIAHAAGRPEVLAGLLDDGGERTEPECVLDLADGIDRACRSVDDRRPRSLHVTYRGRDIGTIPDQPGSEPLRGAHVRAALARELSLDLAQALAREHELPVCLSALVRARAAATEHASEAFAA